MSVDKKMMEQRVVTRWLTFIFCKGAKERQPPRYRVVLFTSNSR